MLKKKSLLWLLPATLMAGSFQNSINFQGFTGLINIPNAEVVQDGDVALSFSNQVDAFRIRKEKDRYTAEHYFVNIGLMPNLEVIGRLANIEDKGPSERAFLDRDLSGSLKYQLPIYHDYLPHIAIGAQDISGIGDRYKAKFVVLSQEYAFMRGTVGYGFGSKHLDGLFGGVEVRATDWLYLLSEYDTQDTRVGVRLTSPHRLWNRFDLALSANKNVNDTKEKISVSLMLKMPLGENHDNIEKVPKTCDAVPDLRPAQVSPAAQTNRPDADTLQRRLASFQHDLVDFGFENLDIGLHGSDRIYVAYENNIMEHNELDAMGVILGCMLKNSLPYQKFELVTKKSNQPVRSVRGDLILYKAFIESISQKSLQDFRYSLRMDTDYRSDIPLRLYAENLNSSYLKTRVELTPGLTTFVATEVGVFDYVVSLRPYIHWNLYKGFDLGVLSDIPLFHSANFDEGGPLAPYDEGAKVKSVFLNRSDTFGGLVNIVSLGMYRDYLGGFDNIAYNMDNHTFGLKIGFLQDDTQSVQDREIYLGSYTYYDDDYDAFVTLGGGKYYNQDTGFDLKFKRFFGDTAVTLFYQHTSNEYVGLGIEIPLTPRKVSDGYLQFKGKNDFAYSIRSSIRDKSGENRIKVSGAVNPPLVYNPQSRFLNRNRLSQSYLRAHLLRLRDVYFRYVVREDTPQ